MGSNSASQGGFLANHVDAEEINRMLKVGHSAQEVADFLKRKHNHKRYWASVASITNYRRNFLNLSKEENLENRRLLKAEGKTRPANAHGLVASTVELMEMKDKAKEKIMNVLDNFKTIEEEARGVISLIKTTSRDEFGKPVLILKNFELMERILGRLESVSVNFAKVSREMTAPDPGSTQITITNSQIQKYQEAFKDIMQKLVVKFDPGLLPDFFKDCDDAFKELEKPNNGDQVRISVSGQGNNQINIVTGNIQSTPSNLPTPEEVAQVVSTMTNENDYMPDDENNISTIIESQIND